MFKIIAKIFFQKPKELGVEVKDKRLENVSSSLLNKCASTLCKTVERETGKPLFTAFKSVSPYLDSWNTFLNSTKKNVLVKDSEDCFSKVNSAIFAFIDNFKSKTTHSMFYSKQTKALPDSRDR